MESQSNNEKETRSEEPRSRVHSMGWLTESSLMPKKQKVIQGVGAGSVVELKAELYKAQEEVKRAKDLEPEARRSRKERGINIADLMSRQNAGVELRNRRDEQQTEAEQDVYGALERKAELYEKLARGDVADDERKERYSVDFFQKGGRIADEDDGTHKRRGAEVEWRYDGTVIESRTSEAERERREREERERSQTEQEEAEAKRKHEARQLIQEVHEETIAGREKGAELKQRRQEQAAKSRERLKAAFLKKQAQKLRTQGTSA